VKENLLKIKDLTYKYDNRSIKGIESISFDLHTSECVGVIGPSGSGKSTALKLIANLLPPQRGTIEQSKDSTLCYVPQMTELPADKTVLEILMDEILEIEDPEKRENQARSVLTLLNITNEINSKTSEISGGQKQRVIIAKALVKNPTILLLDEPFGHLDEKLRFDLMTELFDLFKSNQIAVLWVTHETKEALAFSDKIVVLNHGVIQQISEPKELYFRPQNFFTAQFMGRTNILPTKALVETPTHLRTKLFSRDIELIRPNSFELKDHKDLIVLVKPELINIDPDGRFKAKISKQIFQGGYYLTKILVANEVDLWLYTPERFSVGQNITFSIDLEKIHILNEF
jgi:ABC-type Fe3+/spermidine/putrescine transport system ATPase subunit